MWGRVSDPSGGANAPQRFKGALSEHATERIFRTTQVPFRHKAFSRTGGRKTIHLEKDLMEVLAKTLKPFEEPCPRMKPRGRG
jgi:hypothetical protein